MLKVVPIQKCYKNKNDTPNQNYYAGKRFYCKTVFKGSLGKKKKEKSNREKGKGKRVEGQGEDRKTDSFSPNCQSVLSEVLALLQKQLNNFKQCVCFIERSNRSFDIVPHVPTLLLPIVRSKQFKFREATSWENDRREGLALDLSKYLIGV